MGWDNKMPLKQHGNYAQCEYHQQTAGTDNGAVGMGGGKWMEKSGGFGKILLKMLRLFPSLLVGFLFFLPFFSISLLGV